MEWVFGICLLLGVGFIAGVATNRLEINEYQLTTANAMCSMNGDLKGITVNAMHEVTAHCGNGAVFELKEK